ncbi:phosphotransferase family protein [Micromonospora endolithica]|uniref:Aminoglycoside phosphotransferase family protein n=1 Tax=Micromonospora endolithica TaxID=230091 RepID=A0A3A9ZHP6_9ACTN|nr:aminoglycoside phosphotransferase family protein [Micromonospora endolithica]RKN47878.1 aminoglycoside phosphotransferase family protein [Micromonospora endolithica]TWJ21576.1 fructosamine-3-kinase [Micromonospora endolithica]
MAYPDSPTRRALSPEDVARYVHASFGADRRTADCGPLAGGGFAAVWWVRLDDGHDVVLKVAPAPDVPLLRYERGLAAAEVRYFRLVAAAAPTVAVPPVLHHGVDPDLGEWVFTGRLPGRALSDLASTGVDLDRVRHDFGRTVATLHRVTGDRFGYADTADTGRDGHRSRPGGDGSRARPGGGRAGAATWRDTFGAMVDDLLADATDWAVRLPVSPGRIRSLVDRYGDPLDEVRRPALVHFDGWDGNVLAAPDAGGELRMCGLVDGERWLFGDPLLDLVSPLLFRRAEDEPAHPFLRGYAEATGAPALPDEAARRRLALYRLHLYLLMTVEMPSRGITRQRDPDRHARLARLLTAEVQHLERH